MNINRDHEFLNMREKYFSKQKISRNCEVCMKWKYLLREFCMKMNFMFKSGNKMEIENKKTDKLKEKINQNMIFCKP